MEIKPVGSYLEVACSECGEPLLIGSGDSVNLKLGELSVVAAVPGEILCFVCSRKQVGGTGATIKFLRLVCSCCGRDMSTDGGIPEFDPEIDENGEVSGVFCSDCSEPWRRGECDPT